MDTNIEKLFQRIGQEAMTFADDQMGRVLVYAEVEDGVISADMFYICDGSGSVRFRFCSRATQSLIQELWVRWKNVDGNRAWRVLAYIIDGDDFDIDLSYPEQINDDQDVSERRPLAVRKYFGDARVDYSRPH